MIKSPKASLGYMARLSQEKKKGGGAGVGRTILTVVINVFF